MNTKIINYAIIAHEQTNHLYNGFPYSVHLSMVALFAQKYINELPTAIQSDILDACWLHDTIEDCRLTYNDILKISNKQVADIVYAVTNEKGKNRSERANEKYYNGIREIAFATFVKLCDRLANVLYSKNSKSDMFKKYKSEHSTFIQSLFPNAIPYEYSKMVDELNCLVSSVSRD
jgi:(p)ppGpp synthase/HD superfamily hydrolase